MNLILMKNHVLNQFLIHGKKVGLILYIYIFIDILIIVFYLGYLHGIKSHKFIVNQIIYLSTY